MIINKHKDRDDLTRKGAKKKKTTLQMPNKATPMRQSLQLDPLQISIDMSLQPPHKSTPIHRRASTRHSKVTSTTAPPAPTAEEPDESEKPHPFDSKSPRLKEQVEALETPSETLVKVKKALDEDQEGHLPKGRSQGPRPTTSKTSKKSRDVSHWANKWLYAAVIISLSISVVGGLSIVGLLQSTESVNAYGLVVQHCAQGSGTVQAGESSVRSETFYIKNTNEEAVMLSFTTENWDPPEASEYIELSWDWEESNTLKPGYVCKVTVTLVDKSSIPASDYSFDTVFIASTP